ncbi:threonine synthase [Methylocapsa aurea]|uniref:threonine synthase n=1 Tax=Methylocapsa aurea TaxID=663610 RepID=UPI00055A52CB|nr:threonine synthase [Methylocapsa aurea]
MKYISTRGEAPPVSFTETLIAGLAPDGGLYLPESYPEFGHGAIADFAGQSYADVAQAIVAPFVAGEIEPPILRGMIDAAYASFRHPAVAPLVQIDANLFALELFHGRTLAFKDIAMQLLARLIDHVLQARGQRATIVGATSGDTGAAAIEAFRGLAQVDVFILYPHGRVSEVQRRQMTTVEGDNIHAIALEGTFDDAQACIKALFNHANLREELKLSGVNSINWVRILAQTVYYFTSAVALGGPNRKISYVVPTGNFGDIFAGWIAKRMGLPIERLVIATNSNDILARALASGAYGVTGVHATQSPSMDIQVSSNFERLLFEAHGRNAGALRTLMARLRQSGGFTIEPAPLKAIRAEFDAFSVNETETTQEIARAWREAGYLADPHTAVGINAARRAQAQNGKTPLVVLGTAHPAKFPDAIALATGQRPPLPAHLAGLFDKKEHFTILPNDQKEIERFIRARAGQASRRAAS